MPSETHQHDNTAMLSKYVGEGKTNTWFHSHIEDKKERKRMGKDGCWEQWIPNPGTEPQQ